MTSPMRGGCGRCSTRPCRPAWRATCSPGPTRTSACKILVSDETMKRLHRPVTSRMVDVVAVEGQQTQTAIHEVFVEPPEDAEQWLELFSAGVSAYLAGDFATAQHHFANVGMINPDDPGTRVLAERCRQLDRKPPAGWTGAWKLRGEKSGQATAPIPL